MFICLTFSTDCAFLMCMWPPGALCILPWKEASPRIYMCTPQKKRFWCSWQVLWVNTASLGTKLASFPVGLPRLAKGSGVRGVISRQDHPAQDRLQKISWWLVLSSDAGAYLSHSLCPPQGPEKESKSSVHWFFLGEQTAFDWNFWQPSFS